MKRWLCISSVIALSGCGYPTSTIVQGTAQGHVRITQAPVGAAVEVDGRILGYKTKAEVDVFDVAPGRRKVRILSGAQILESKEYLIAPGSVIEIKAQ